MPWQPGQSGNEAGRPKGLAGEAKMIMRETRDGAELVERALTVGRGPKRPMREHGAHEWLRDARLGRALGQYELHSRA
jgi:hypothetical protein